MNKHPQSKAAQLAPYAHYLQAVADNSCLAQCYLKCIGVDGDEIDYILNCCKAIDEDLLTSQCFVKNADNFIFAFTGRKVKVIKKPCYDISQIKNPTPVLFKAEGKEGHWVVVANGEIIFNSVLNSYNVTCGHPVEMREIQWQ